MEVIFVLLADDVRAEDFLAGLFLPKAQLLSGRLHAHFENRRWLSENRMAGTMQMDSANSRLQPSNDDSPAREKLIALRLALLRVHKTLLEMERRIYERDHGKVGAGELFRLVVDHAQFAWLHNISEFVVRIDESLAAKEPVTPEHTSVAFSLARKMFVPTESGDAFQKNYFDAIQKDPAVVMEHAELVRLFNNEPLDTSAA